MGYAETLAGTEVDSSAAGLAVDGHPADSARVSGGMNLRQDESLFALRELRESGSWSATIAARARVAMAERVWLSGLSAALGVAGQWCRGLWLG